VAGGKARGVTVASDQSRGGPTADPTLGGQPDEKLFRLAKEGDAAARDELVERYLPLGKRLAGRYRHTNEPQDDLEQVAALALVKAIDRFDPDVGAFVPYAVPSVLGELKRHFRDKGWAMRVPRSLKERHLKVSDAIEELTAREGHSPTAGELAEALDLELEQVLEAIEAAGAYAPTTLDAPPPGSDEDQRGIGERMGAVDERFELVELGQSVAPAFQELPERQQQILRLRFVDDLTQSEIARVMGISQMHVSRLIRRSIEELREAAGGE
jgi:RNA polymerase sigma-B factor